MRATADRIGAVMPAVSKRQQRFMAMAEHEPGKLRGKKPKMSKSQMHDFAATPRKGLPMKKGATRYRSN